MVDVPLNTKTPAGVAIVIRNQSGEVLFTRRKKVGLQDKWSVPGGAVLFGEQPKDAVHREALEEAGVRVQSLDLYDAEAETYPNGEHHVVLFYRAVVWLADEDIQVHRDYEVAWFSRDDFPAYEDMMPPLDRVIRRMIHTCTI